MRAGCPSGTSLRPGCGSARSQAQDGRPVWLPFRQHLLPTFGYRPVSAIREPNVRAWRQSLLESGVSSVTAAKAYRLLKAILNTAADDGLIRRNPAG